MTLGSVGPHEPGTEDWGQWVAHAGWAPRVSARLAGGCPPASCIRVAAAAVASSDYSRVSCP